MKKLLFVLASIAMLSLVALSAAIAFAPEHVHSYTSEITKEATCDNGGEITYTCSCGYYAVIKQGATGHSFTNYVSDNNATCTEDGTKTAKCDNCDATKTLPANNTAKGHAPAEAVQENVVNASCSDDGSYESVVYCVNGCGLEYSRETVIVEATGEHVYATETERVDATCTEDGYVIMACGCEATERTELPATGHSYGAPTYAWSDDYSSCVATEVCLNDASHTVTKEGTVTSVTTPSTCKEAGKTVYTATFDAEGYETQTAEAELPLGEHTKATIPAVAPLCVYDGLSEGSYCSACGEIIVAQTVVPATGSAHTWNGTSCTTCNAVKFEAETFEIINKTTDKAMVGNEGKGAEATNYPSGDAFIFNLQYALGTTLKFEVNSSVDQTVQMSFSMGIRQYVMTPSESFVLKVNGEVCEFAAVEFPIFTTIQYFEWTELMVATIDLKAGNNVIEFTRTQSDHALNFDYVAIRPLGGTVADPREVNGHSYTNWSFATDPDYETAGSASSYCDYCRIVKTVDLPVVSAENGYKQLSYGVKSVWIYTTNEGYEIRVEVLEEAKKFTYNVTATDDVFSSFVDNNGPATATGRSTNKDSNSYGTFYELTQGATFNLKVNASQATEAVLVLKLCANSGGEPYYYQNIMKNVSVTGGGQTVAGVVNAGNVILPSNWKAADAIAVEIATINLQAGENIITFTMGDLNINIAGVEILAFADITHEPTKVNYGGKIADFDPFIAENGGSVAAGTQAPKKTAEGNSNGIYYEKNNTGATFTMTVTVEQDIDVILQLDMTSTNNKAYAISSILSSVTSKDATGANNQVVLNATGSVTTKGWNAANDVKADYATISLKKGTNTITFVFGSNNLNISGVYLICNCDLVFGAKEN